MEFTLGCEHNKLGRINRAVWEVEENESQGMDHDVQRVILLLYFRRVRKKGCLQEP